MPPRILSQNRIDEVRLEDRIQRPNQRLIADKEIARAAGRTDAAAIFCVADQFAAVSCVLDHIAKRQTIVGVDLMVDSSQTHSRCSPSSTLN